MIFRWAQGPSHWKGLLRWCCARLGVSCVHRVWKFCSRAGHPSCTEGLFLDGREARPTGKGFSGMEHKRILVVEDDAAIRMGVRDALAFSGYRVLEATDAQTGLDAAMDAGVDLVLLDIMLPGRDGTWVLGQLRKVGRSVPVIFLTARGESEDRVRGLRLGADDYVVKPFNAGELIARVEAVLRRSAERPHQITRLAIMGRVIDFARRQVRLADGRSVMLTEREAEVLEYLAANRGRAISREELLRRVWGVDPRGMQTRTVDMTIARLRDQLGETTASPEVVLTVRSKGYMLAADDGEGAEGDGPC